MSLSQLFKEAHLLAKFTNKAGYNYHATFSACLKELWKSLKKQSAFERNQISLGLF